MSQTFTQMLEKVEKFHDKHDFANEENNGHDMSYRILLTIEELGELAECFTKGKSKKEKATKRALEESIKAINLIHKFKQESENLVSLAKYTVNRNK